MRPVLWSACSTGTGGGLMIKRLASHVRSNVVGYTALFVALGGTGYAATELPRGSVGTAQLRSRAVTAPKVANGAISPAKFNRKMIGGSIRHWARVAASGSVLSSSGRTLVRGAPGQGGYVLSWGDTFSRSCAAVATPSGASIVLGPSPGVASTYIFGAQPTSVTVDTYNAQGQPTPAAFSVAVIC